KRFQRCVWYLLDRAADCFQCPFDFPHQIRDRKVSSLVAVGNITESNGASDYSIAISFTVSYCVDQRVVIEHLGHVAFAAIPVATLNRSGFRTTLCSFWISPDAETFFDYLACHSRKVETRD